MDKMHLCGFLLAGQQCRIQAIIWCFALALIALNVSKIWQTCTPTNVASFTTSMLKLIVVEFVLH